jgi:hypothetical protein
MKLPLCLVLQFIFILPVFASTEASDEKIYKHCTFFNKGENLQYLVEDVIEQISHRSKLSISNVNAPIKRCVQMMGTGEVDFMLSIRVDEYTSKHMDFIFVSDELSKIIFYIRKSDGDWLNRYSDLQGETVGVMSDLAYFDRFDLDDSVKKLSVNKTKQLPKILEASRVKAYVTYAGLADSNEDNATIVKAPYFHSVKMAILGIYKNSPMQSQRLLLEDTVNSIMDDGTFAKLRRKYMTSFQTPDEAQQGEQPINKVATDKPN